MIRQVRARHRFARRGSLGSNAPLLLLLGTPGTGKRPVGNYLAQAHGFVHLDFEHPETCESFLASTDAELAERLAALGRAGRGLVITWSAGPVTQLRHVRRLRAARNRTALVRQRPRRRLPGAFRRCSPRAPVSVRRLVRARRELPPARGARRGAAAPAAAAPAAAGTGPPRGRSRFEGARDGPAVGEGCGRGGPCGRDRVRDRRLLSGGGSGAAARASPPRPAGAPARREAPRPRGARERPQPGRDPPRRLDGEGAGALGRPLHPLPRSHQAGMWCYIYPPPDRSGRCRRPVRGRQGGCRLHARDDVRVALDHGDHASGSCSTTRTRGHDGTWLSCAGYSAKATPNGHGAVTSILTLGPSVYGFALTRPSVSPCH